MNWRRPSWEEIDPMKRSEIHPLKAAKDSMDYAAFCERLLKECARNLGIPEHVIHEPYRR